MTDDFSPGSGDLASGTRVAGYQIGAPIGHGGMAVVYRAHDVQLERWVALKILAPEMAGDESFRQRFIRESRAAAAVDHPHVIPVFEAGEADGVLFIAMRYVGGGDVRTLLSRLGPMDAGRAGTIVTQVASALDAAHACRLVHRDVKPANMLLGAVAGSGQPDHVYLSDFGLSKESLSSAGLTMAGQFLGTLDYIAPEQIEGRPVDGRTDLYALACAAFEMLSGAPPFRHDQKEALVWAQLSQDPPPLTARRADLAPQVDRVMAKALAKSPDDRYATCLEFAAALRSACGLESDPGPLRSPRVATELARPVRQPSPVQPSPVQQPHPVQPRPPSSWPPPPPSRSSPSRPPGRRPRAAIAAGVLVVLAIAGGAFAVLRAREAASPAPAGSPGAAAPGQASPSGGGSPSGRGSPASSAGAAAVGPAGTVRAYIAAINSKDYARAWDLGGRNTGGSYQDFVNGYSTTARDTATILSVTGDVVTARLRAVQTDGTVKIYQGTYTVAAGVITSSDVQQVG